MATEKQVEEGMRDSFLEISEYFDGDSVLINEAIFLDKSIQYMPAVNILTSDEFTIIQDAPTAELSYPKPVLLYVAFVDWKVSRDQFRDVRQAVFDKYNEVGTARSAGGLDGVTIDNIRNVSNIIGMGYAGEPAPVQPVYLVQELVFEVNLF